MLILGGREFETKRCESVNWTNTGMAFTAPGDCYARGASRVAMAAMHWTGGEGDAKDVYSVLKARGLSVDFTIERDGRIVQHSDPAKLATWHAGSINRRSWGVEVINGAVKALASKDRIYSTQTIHGSTAQYADFFDAQVRALAELLTIVNGFFGIPMKVPRDGSGALLATAMRPEDLATFTGVVGHFHVTKSKVDPGIEVWHQLAKAGIQWL
jgi:hypothetical protein